MFIRRSTTRAMGSDSDGASGRSLWVFVVVLVVVGVPTAVWAVDVRGTLAVPSDFASMTPPLTDAQLARARYWEEWNGVLEPLTHQLEIAREFAVVLTGDGPVSEGEQPPFRLHNGTLFPATLVVRVGAGFQIRNDDGVSYELYAEGNDEFGPVQTAPGNARPVTISSAGNWPVRDRIHPHVRGHIHALPNLVARAFLDSDGTFTFRGVRPGSYRLHVFHGAREVTSQEITIPEGGSFQAPAISVMPRSASP
jgi:hypothetical protein